MATLTLPKISSLREINKWPLAFVCVVLIWLSREFLFDNRSKSKENVDTLNKQVYRLEKEIAKRDTSIAYWQSKYIIEVEKNASYFKRQDSANRAALEKPAKEILKTINQNSDEKQL